MTDSSRYLEAKRKVDQIKGFYIHIAVFVLVMGILLAVNVAKGAPWWVQWPAIGWGLGLLGHAALVYGRSPTAIGSWEKRKIKEIMSKEPSA